jgi:putative ABC transport system permease protein
VRRLLLRSWLWKPTVEDEVDAELAFHREMRLREYLALGLTPEQARRAVDARFGDLTRARTACRQLGKERDRAMLRHEYFAELRQDLRFGLRQLWKDPTFAFVAVLTLALGIGGTTAIFSVVNAVVLRPLPLHEPDRLAYLFETGRTFQRGGVSAGNLTEWSRRNDVFVGLTGIQWSSFNVTEGATPERVVGAFVAGPFFEVLGGRAALGRVFGEAEQEPGRDDVVVLSHRLWTRLFGGNPSIVGREVRLSGRSRTVLGVMPASFELTADSEELWAPAALPAARKADFDNHYLTVLARLRPGVTLDQARAQLTSLAVQLEKEQPLYNAERRATAVPMMEIFVGDYRQRLFVLFGAVSLVLLIACGNVANLLLARGTVRSTEIAVRAALGAGRGRLVRQLLTENALLAMVGAGLGLLFARVALQTLVQAGPPGVPRLDQARLDLTTLAFAVLIALGSSLAFGLVPAWRGTRVNTSDRLGSGRSGGLGASRDRVRAALVAIEVALALVLLVGSGLLIRTALALDAVDPGYDPKGVLSSRVALPRDQYLDDTRVVQTLERMVEETRGIPGVTSAAVVSQVPLGPGGNGNGLIPEGRPLDPKSAILSRLRLVSPGYFETMRIRLVDGRGFTDADRRGVQKVMIISEALAREAWPNERAVGKRMGCCEPGAGGPRTMDFKVVIGVTADVRSAGPALAPAPEFYLPIAQAPASPPGAAWDWVQRTMYIVARTPADPTTLIGHVGQALRRIDPSLPLFNVRTMEQRQQASTATSRFNTLLLTALGLVGLVLSAIGVYGVIAYFVSQRTQEIGVRLALGAAPTDVIRLVIGQALRPVVVGLVVGIAAALAATRVLTTQLYGVGPRDPGTIALVCVTFVVVALLASWAPARRAASVDPTRALNQS